MKELRRKGLAIHSGPESCIDSRKAVDEALTGENAGQPLSCEIQTTREPTLLSEAEGNTLIGVNCESVGVSAQSETLSMHGHSLHGNREILKTSATKTDRLEKAQGYNPSMNVFRKSDSCVVPEKYSNKGGETQAESMEGRQVTEGNTTQGAESRTQSRVISSSALCRVRETARKDRRVKFTNLMHHITVELLKTSFYLLKKQAAPGIDGMTWTEYEKTLPDNLKALHNKVHRGSYHAQPSKRQYIPKADGKLRPLGIAALEDKVVQQAVVTVLNSIYEEDFLGFSYGFRPGRGQHMALDALYVAIMHQKVNWVLDADIQTFFDTINHEWLLKFLEHRIADRRILRLIQKWLKAGVIEEGKRTETELGTPQGAVISPLLANIYLHYVYDLWVHQWRKKAIGQVVVVRYADDTIVGFQRKGDAERFLQDLQERMKKFDLRLHPEKTRLLEFGRFTRTNKKARGEGKPETFNFLGFTHICGQTLKRGFLLERHTISKRLRQKLKDLKIELMRRKHDSIEALGAWLRSVVQGYFNYHAIPSNIYALGAFRTEVIRTWYSALKRRSQRKKLNWVKFNKIVLRWIPRARIIHPYPQERFYARYPR